MTRRTKHETIPVILGFVLFIVATIWFRDGIWDTGDFLMELAIGLWGFEWGYSRCRRHNEKDRVEEAERAERNLTSPVYPPRD